MWVEGIQRIVCGVTETTTCQDVVYALAHATGKTGRFTLIERWRNNERLLAPQEHPLKVLTKWGEYSNDVQFILQRSGTNTSSGTSGGAGRISHSLSPTSPPPSPSDIPPPPPDRNKDIRKSLTFSSGGSGGSTVRRTDNVGVVRGVPQSLQVKNQQGVSPTSSSQQQVLSSGNETGNSPQQQGLGGGRREAPPYRDPPGPVSHLGYSIGGQQQAPRALPPYRNPPPPNQPRLSSAPLTMTSPTLSNLTASTVANITSSTTAADINKIKPKRNLLKDFDNVGMVGGGLDDETVLYNAQYRDLICLVNYQRDKLSAQQAELTKYDAEIVFWEGKTREQQHQIEFMAQETARIEAASRQAEDQLRLLGPVEEENEIVRQQEKTLKSELTLLRSKLANCETELLQCKNKIRVLMEEVAQEVRAGEERSQMERTMLVEVERLQREVEEAKQGAELAAQSADSLRKEVASLESAITEKKRQVERLVSDMKEANLQSLAVAPPEELKLLLEGPHKPGSTRRMIGSPRQLENAVPTSKNPHGVWV